MIVKICGIKTVEAAQIAIGAGTNFIGFIFAPSKRKIKCEDAQSIAQTIPPSIKKVGVFVNETVENMHLIGKQVGLDIIQLHGDESAEIAKQLSDLSYQVIRAVSADRLDFFQNTEHYPYDYVLLDSPPKEHRGGSGEPFDWSIVSDLPVEQNKLILAGGLSPENVREAIKLVQPAGVDVSSGVETNGVKDLAKIKAFIENVRFAESSLK